MAGIVVGLVMGLGGRDVSPDTPDKYSAMPSGGGSWLVMIYSDAEDDELERDMCLDLNEAELAGSTDQVKVVAQIDRYAGAYAGDGDVSSARRYLLVSDSDLDSLNSELLADLGEVDMGDPQTLYDFATWAIAAYPADHYVLILSDHGMGWAGGWFDDDPYRHSGLSMQQIDSALGSIVTDTGIDAFELVGFDACLMAQLEVMSAVAPHARYAVASEETEPSLGWSYSVFLETLMADTSISGRELGQAIVDSYLEQDVAVLDEGLRGARFPGNSAEDVASEVVRPYTLSAVDLSQIRDLDEALNKLAVALSSVDQQAVAEARRFSQSYTSIWGQKEPPSFLDLGHFVASVLERIEDEAVSAAGRQVQEVLARAVVAEKHGDMRPGSSGVSIYFPNSTHYSASFGGTVLDYPSSVGRFATASLWDDFLTFHYTGKPIDTSAFDLSVVTPALAEVTDFSEGAEGSAPASGTEVVGPGSGGVAIAPISVSAERISADDTVILSTGISGSNIAYVYYYVAYFWEEDGSYLSADGGYLEPGYVKEVGGVYYPEWGDGETVDVEAPWTPALYAISDGDVDNDQFAFLWPIEYGAERAGDIYAVYGTYTSADTGFTTEAEMEFNGEGDMVGLWGYDAEGETSIMSVGTWHELIPQPGDTFTIELTFLEFDEDPDGAYAYYDGGVMTFGETPLTIVQETAPPGDYVIGFIVEDLDGRTIEEYSFVTVTE